MRVSVGVRDGQLVFVWVEYLFNSCLPNAIVEINWWIADDRGVCVWFETHKGLQRKTFAEP